MNRPVARVNPRLLRCAAALLSALVLATQTAGVTHRHADESLPAGQPAKVCDLCTALHAKAPAPEASASAQHVATPLRLAAAPERLSLPSRPACAHRSRAPPFFRSI
ncbi:MAG: hypothetical protein ACRES3_07395 [Steroidobacteraceae bacterium]